MGEDVAALLTTRLAAVCGVTSFVLEGDALLVVLAINTPLIFSSWNFASFLSNINLVLSSFHSWSAVKVSRCVNFRAHVLAKWDLVFGSISIGSSILSSIRIKNGKNPPL
jgi:hypothetical protein